MMKKTVLIFIIIIILSLILVLNAGCNGLPQTNLPDIPSEPEERYQSFVHSDTENRFYFVDGTLYKQNLSIKAKTAIFRLEPDQAIGHFCFSGNNVYFVLKDQGAPDNSFSICQIDDNGRNFKVLLDDSFLMPEDDGEGNNVHALAAAEGCLVIQISFSLYVHNMTTGQTVKISPDARQIEISRGKLYYLSDFSVVERDLKSGREKVILQSAYNDMDREQSHHLYSSFIFVNGVLFYCQRLPHGLYRYENGVSTAVYEGKGIDEYCLTQYGGNLYFVVTDATQSVLYRYDPKKDALALIQYLPNYNFNGGDKIIDGVYYYHNHMEWVETIPLPSGSELSVSMRYVKPDGLGNPDDEGDWLCGVVDADGNLIVECNYQNIKILSKNRICAITDYYASATIFDAKGNPVCENKYHMLSYFLSPVTGEYFPVGCADSRESDANGNAQRFLVDFDGNRVFDKDITRILRYGNDPIADDPNVLIAVDTTGQLYIIDAKGNITKK